MIKALIFDCFGVIYPDTLMIVGRPYVKLGDPRREQIRELRKQCDLGFIGRNEFWDKIAGVIGISRAELDKKLDAVRGPDWELLDYIQNLKKDYKTALFSNVGRDFLQQIFDDKHPSANYFDKLITSYETGLIKPDPAAYRHALDELGVKPGEVIFIDDRPRNVTGAKAVGIPTILYHDFEQFKTDLQGLL